MCNERRQTMDKDDMPKENRHLKAEFETRICTDDIVDFQLYHLYHSFPEVFKIMFFFVIFEFFAICFKNTNMFVALLFAVVGVFWAISVPYRVIKETKKQMKNVDSINQPIRFVITEDGIQFGQNGVKEEKTWNDVSKVKCTHKNLIIYISDSTAYIIPLVSIGNQADQLITIAERKLRSYQLGIKRDKVVAKAEKLGRKAQ